MHPLQKCDQCGIFTSDLARHLEERHKTSNDEEVDEGAETEVDEEDNNALNRSFMSEMPLRPKRHKNTNKNDGKVQKSRLKKSFSVANITGTQFKRKNNFFSLSLA